MKIKKSLLLIAFSLTLSLKAFSQDTLIIKPVMSSFLSDWERNENNVFLSLNNNTPDTIIIRFHSVLMSNQYGEILRNLSNPDFGINDPSYSTLFSDTTHIPSTDTITKIDTLKPGINTYNFFDIIPTFNSIFSDTVINDSTLFTYIQNERLPKGNYSINIAIVDTLGDTLSTYPVFTKSFYVTEALAPSNSSPNHNQTFCLSSLHTKLFEWTEITADTAYDTVLYNFQVKEVVSGQTEEYIVNNNPPIISISMSNSTQLYIPNYATALLDTNKEYLWYVEATDLETSDPIGTNEGRSIPHIFKTVSDYGSCPPPPTTSDFCSPFSGFEDGPSSINTWDTYTADNRSTGFARRIYRALYADGLYDVQKNAPIFGRHTIVPSGVNDPYTGQDVVPPGGGGYSLKLGEDVSGGFAEIVSKRFQVTNENSQLKVWYSVVMQDGGHSSHVNPYFRIRVTRGTDPKLKRDVLYRNKIIANIDDPFFSLYIDPLGPSQVVYRKWDCLEIDLREYVGETVSLEFTTSDCGLSEHWTYAYIDLCNSTSPTPNFTLVSEVCYSNISASSGIIADGTSSINENFHSWKIEELDGSGNPVGGVTTQGIEFPAIEAGEFDIWDFYTIQRGQKFGCNKTYRVTLGVRTSCTNWNYQSKDIFFKCPAQGLAGSAKCFPPGPGTRSVQIGAPAVSGYTYLWQVYAGSHLSYLSSTTVSNPTVTLPSGFSSVAPLYYYVNVTDANGCTDVSEVVLYIEAPNVSIVETGNSCDIKLEAIADEGITNFQWIDLRTTATIGYGKEIFVSPEEKQSYRVIVSNPCGTDQADIEVDPKTVLRGGFPELTYTNIMGTNWGNLTITEWDKAIGVDAYNAYEYELYYLDRWGGYILVNSKTNAKGTSLKNGDIVWDGRLNGKKVPNGVHILILYLKNCSKRSFIHNYRFSKLHCPCKLVTRRRWIDLGVFRDFCQKEDKWNSEKCDWQFKHGGETKTNERSISVTVEW